MGDPDLYDNYQPVLDLIHSLMCEMKVPHKSKKFEQKFVRTMFFRDTLVEKIDGKDYEITKETKVHVYNCAETLQAIVEDCKADTLEMYCNKAEDFPGWRKKFVEKFKKFDKLYMQHPKIAHPTIFDIHTKTMKPLSDLIESNFNLDNFEHMMENQQLPEFRLLALEEKFAKDLTLACDISRDHGKLGYRYYDIRRMMKLLKLEHKVKNKEGKWEELHWKKIKPFHFYLDPLETKYKYMREELLHLNHLGPLYYRFPLEANF